MRKWVLYSAAAAAMLTAVQRAGAQSTITTTSFGGNVTDQSSSPVTANETITSVGMTDSASGYYEREGNIFSGYTYYYYYSYSSSSYAGTVVTSGRPVVGFYNYSNGEDGSYSGGSVTGTGATGVASNGQYKIYTAANGNTVSESEEAVGYGGYETGTSESGLSIQDAPTPSASNVVAYLQTFASPVGQSPAVPVQIGTTSLTATRNLLSVGSALFASPYEDQIDMKGTLYLNGTPVGTFDDPLIFAAGDSTTSRSLANDLSTVNVDFSGVLTPTATLTLDWSVVETGYDALGNTTQTTLTSGDTPEVVSVPEPTSVGLIGIGGMGLLARRRRRASSGK